MRARSVCTSSGAFARRAFHGDQLDVTIVVTNRSRWPQTIVEVRDSVPNVLALDAGSRTSFAASLPARGSEHLTYSVVCGRRGYHRVGPMSGCRFATCSASSRARSSEPETIE